MLDEVIRRVENFNTVVHHLWLFVRLRCLDFCWRIQELVERRLVLRGGSRLSDFGSIAPHIVLLHEVELVDIFEVPVRYLLVSRLGLHWLRSVHHRLSIHMPTEAFLWILRLLYHTFFLTAQHVRLLGNEGLLDCLAVFLLQYESCLDRLIVRGGVAVSVGLRLASLRFRLCSHHDLASFDGRFGHRLIHFLREKGITVG